MEPNQRFWVFTEFSVPQVFDCEGLDAAIAEFQRLSREQGSPPRFLQETEGMLHDLTPCRQFHASLRLYLSLCSQGEYLDLFALLVEARQARERAIQSLRLKASEE